MKKRVIFGWIFLIILTTPILLGIQHDGSYTGRVVDAETGEPIEGAAVLGIRQLIVWGMIELKLKYFDASEATTDKYGRFEVPSVTGFYLYPFGRLARTEFIIFKPGYDSYPPYDLMRPGITGMEQHGFLEQTNNIVRLSKINNDEQRLRVLSGVSYPLYSSLTKGLSKKFKQLSVLVKNEEKRLGMPLGGSL